MNSQTPADHDISRSVVVIVGVLAAGAITAAIGLLALVGWVLGPPVLAGFGAGLIPMAPSTAVLFLLYGEAICVRARPPLGRRAFRTSVAAACVGMLVALVLFALSYLGINWAGEHAGASITGTIGGAPIGHMSPVTAFCFLVASVSFLASLSRLSAAPTRWRAVLALGLAGVLLGMCFVFLLAYLFGAPLLYGGRYIPPALNTILAFTTLGVALLALAGWPAGQSDESRPSGFRTALTLVSILVLLSAGIVATGYIYYRNYEQRYRAEVERQLSVIADLKVGQLEQYRKERLGDGAVLHRNASFSDLVRRFLGRPEDANAHQQLRAWIGAYQSHYQYDRVFLLDATGVLRMSAPDSSQAVTSVLMARVPEILRSNQVIFQDFYRHEQDQRVYLSVLVPLRDEAAGDRPLGVLVLRIDPATYVYPFISRWPTPNRTAETLLVRKEGNDAVFLNELRFQTNTALNLRSPLSRATMPAVQAALGRQGITEGLDYRGVPVVAALRTVPNSPWALVARMDTAEVYAPLRERLWLTVLLMGALVLGAGASLGLVWREQSVRFYKGQAHAAEALSKSEHRYRTLFDAIDEGFCIVAVIFDEHDKSIDYRFLEINPSFEKQTGLIDALGKRMRDLAPKHEEHWFAIYGKIALTGQPARFVNRADQLNRWYDVYAFRVGRPEDRHVAILFNDITERKQAQEEIETLLRTTIDGYYLVDRDGRFLDTNDSYCQMIGYGRDELLKMGVKDIEAIDSDEVIRARIQRIVETGYARFETRHRRKDGREIDIEASVNLLGGRRDKLVVFMRDITERKQAERSLRDLLLQLSRAEDVERRRIGRELHDSTGQKLAALSMTVGLLQDTTGAPTGTARKMFADCTALVEQCAQEIRTFSYLLHPPLLDELGLAAAISDYIDGFTKRSGVQVALDAPPGVERLSDEIEIALFRVVQEGLANVHRHSGTSTARILLSADAEQVMLEVRDQGRGMSPEIVRAIQRKRGDTSVGIAGMRERLRLLGGRLEIESDAQGTTVRATIPRRQEPT